MKNLVLSYDIKKESILLMSLKRHISFFLKYLTIRKSLNLIIAYFEYKLKVVKCISYPVYLRFEICDVCNLKCTGCPLGGAVNKADEKVKRNIISFKNFVECIKDFIPFLLKINLYDEGEPFLNKEIYKIIKYLHNNNVASCVSSNFSLKFSDEDFKKMIDSKLDHLIVAVDGVNQESYSSYRKGGDFNLVISNIKRLTYFINLYKSSLKVEFQYLEFEDSNKEHLNQAKELAKSLDVWKFTAIKDCSREGWDGYLFKGCEEERRKCGCYQIWFSGSILSNGDYHSCDFGEDSGMKSVGLAKDFSVNAIRNHEKTIALRKSFKGGYSLNDICKKCPLTVKKMNYKMPNKAYSA